MTLVYHNKDVVLLTKNFDKVEGLASIQVSHSPGQITETDIQLKFINLPIMHTDDLDGFIKKKKLEQL